MSTDAKWTKGPWRVSGLGTIRAGVKAIDGNEAWVQVQNGLHTTFLLAELTLDEGA
jgi:hypothetical protein